MPCVSRTRLRNIARHGRSTRQNHRIVAGHQVARRQVHADFGIYLETNPLGRSSSTRRSTTVLANLKSGIP